MECIINENGKAVRFKFNLDNESYDYQCELEVPEDKDKQDKIEEYLFLYYKKEGDFNMPYYECGSIFQRIYENIKNKDLVLFDLNLRKDNTTNSILQTLFIDYDILVKTTILSRFNKEPYIYFEVGDYITLMIFKLNGKCYKYELEIFHPDCDYEWYHYYMRCAEYENKHHRFSGYQEFCNFFVILAKNLDSDKNLTLFDLDVRKEFANISIEKLKKIFYNFNEKIKEKVCEAMFMGIL